ncbi:MAG: DNA polymerase III subunit delta' [Nitrosomonadaceae bacterium]|nr:DNA polymerase III subunit delta' [Nitrosomonadaceae bacterium]|tara:strand:- start:458 stop:1513 length:1056 start_codon:yes stop_codon:yes gene_type:complete
MYPWQNKIWEALVKNNTSIGHAILLKGKKGIGKLGFAKSMAKFLLCESQEIIDEACDNCLSCRWFEQNSHPDFNLVEPDALAESSNGFQTRLGSTSNDKLISTKLKNKPSKQIGIDKIRALSDVINMSSHRNGYKIILIQPAESMNIAAANALLKNLEEPPPQTLFILVAHNPHGLLPTIRSRCKQITMPVPELSLAKSWLEQNGVKEAHSALALVSNSPLTALENNTNNYYLEHMNFINNISALKKFNPLALAEELQKTDLPTMVNWMQKWCYDLMSYRITGKIRYHLSMQSRIEELVLRIDLLQLAGYLRRLIDMQRLAHHTLNPRLFLEEILISYAQLMAQARGKYVK